jgi:hypothetical protein
MTVVVMGADRDDCERSVCGGQERWIRMRAAVMRDLQHVRPQVCPGREQLLLSLDFGVSGKQDANSVTLCPQYQRRIVRIGPGAVKRARWPEDDQRDRSDVQRQTWRRPLGLQVPRPERVSDEAGTGLRLGEWTSHDAFNSAPV